MENLKKLYKKDIDRKIEGVIIAGEDDFQAQELDEYIVTAEVLKYITTFFNAYKTSIEGNIAYNRDNKDIGVWISGFYGSGKSHFLKILSYLGHHSILMKPLPFHAIYSYFHNHFHNHLDRLIIFYSSKEDDSVLAFHRTPQ